MHLGLFVRIAASSTFTRPEFIPVLGSPIPMAAHSTSMLDFRLSAKYKCDETCMESTGKYWIPVFTILEKTCWVTLVHVAERGEGVQCNGFGEVIVHVLLDAGALRGTSGPADREKAVGQAVPVILTFTAGDIQKPEVPAGALVVHIVSLYTHSVPLAGLCYYTYCFIRALSGLRRNIRKRRESNQY